MSFRYYLNVPGLNDKPHYEDEAFIVPSVDTAALICPCVAIAQIVPLVRDPLGGVAICHCEKCHAEYRFRMPPTVGVCVKYQPTK